MHIVPTVCKRHPIATTVLVWLIVMTPLGMTAEAAFHLEYVGEPTEGLRFMPEVEGLRTQPPARYEPLRASGTRSGPSVTIVEPASRWDCIAEKESGNQPLACAPYCGRLQWLPSTWRAAGGTRYAPTPQQATYEQEKAVADAWLAQTSWGQWPSTSRACGYR